MQEIEKEKEALEKEKNNVQQINAKNAGLRSYLKGAHKRLNKSFIVLIRAEERIGRLDAQISILKAENSALLEERAKLSGENETMKMKLNSREELKRAIRGLKRQAYIQGNHGFLLKDGQPTSSVKVKIEVVPASK